MKFTCLALHLELKTVHSLWYDGLLQMLGSGGGGSRGGIVSSEV